MSSATSPRTYKTVLDAYNGYHQVPLDKESVKLTTFITEFGRYQYLRVPQGHTSSGDAYTRQYDDIIADVPRKHKITDDVLLDDTGIEASFWHAFDFLVLCWKNGVTINPTKFLFARRDVDFVGFHVGWDNYRPSDDMLRSIKEFPMPEQPSLSDIRAWFGIVNQLAPYLVSAPLMSPFRDLLKPSNATKGKKVYWDEQLNSVFEETKQIICKVASEGLAYFDTSKVTAVITDWCKIGIGFLVKQKHCDCKEIVNHKSLCCEDGWKLAFCNSRHTLPSESDYAPIEGEALAVSWALRKGRMFLLGCPKFNVITDHQPLIKILDDKSLGDIENPRLVKFKERTLAFNFDIHYVEGAKNHANVFSRYPVNVPDREDIDLANEMNHTMLVNASISAESILITLEAVSEAGSKDPQYQTLLATLKGNNFANSQCNEKGIIREFHNVRDRLSIINNVIMYMFQDGKPRIVIPRELRSLIIDNLHAANQGSTSMAARARQSVYWPGMDRDIQQHASDCRDCRGIAPSPPPEPLIMTDPPEYPFQQVVADLFEKEGYQYLAYADRLTGFVELGYFSSSVPSSAIINTLREFFQRWGVAEEISLDGGPNLSFKEVKDWLKSWGVKIRPSSAYYPQSNGRAEVAVKTLKRLLQGNTGSKGTINTDNVAKALLQYRNTPLRDVNKSPAQLALGRDLRDGIPVARERYKVDLNWAHYLRERERKMFQHNKDLSEKSSMSRNLKQLVKGNAVLCQNSRTKKWDKSGV